jgi:hypothetical protein
VKLRPGKWSGRGSFVVPGQGRGTPFESAFTIVSDARGTQATGTIDAKEPGAIREFSVWITPDDIGTYTLMVTVPGTTLRGTAKLESVPHLALLWSESGHSSVAATLFPVSGGYGFRGFARGPKGVVTWEMVLQETIREVKGDNVVRLSGRKKH